MTYLLGLVKQKMTFPAFFFTMGPMTPRLKRLRAEKKARTARNSLIEYVLQTFPTYRAAKHLVEIAEHLEAVERGEIDRLIIVEPPRHGKSLLVSQRFPAWYLGRHPKDQVIHCSYGGELATGFGRRLRNLMTTTQHQAVFPNCRLAEDSKAVNLWHTNHDGVYVAAGVGGAITGRGSDLLLIDDPVKSREEAESEVMRNRTWDWYQNDAYTRLMPGGRIIIISTRWHEDDLVGKLLKEQELGSDKWTVLHHPAISDTGNALWPEQFDIEALRRTQRIVGPRAWASLYQGDPAPEEGVYFKREWIERGVPPRKDAMRTYGASDYAVTDSGGDYTVHLVCGMDSSERLWVLDLWRNQTTADKWIPPVLDMMKRWEPICWAEEKGQIEKSIGPFLMREQLQRKVYCRRVQFASSNDKPVRARSIQARCANRGLWLPAAAPWAADLENELLKFPTGAHDDIVDTLSLVGRMLAGLETGSEPVLPEKALEEGEMTLNNLLEREDKRRGVYA